MKKIVAAWIEQIILFDTEENADIFCEEMKQKDHQFQLLDYDNTETDEYPNGYTIRIVKSYNNNVMLVSSTSIDNDPNI